MTNRNHRHSVATMARTVAAVIRPAAPTCAHAWTLLCLLAVLAATALTIIPWHVLNQRVPIWDGAEFVLNAQRISNAFAQSLASGLHALYLERGWRPIIFPAYASPFFLLFGEIRPSVAATLFVSTLVTVVYVFLYLASVAGRVPATLGAVFILSLSWFNAYASLFYSEMLWLAATAGMVFHLTASYRRKVTRHWMVGGVWLGIMGAVRPIETVALTVIPAAALLAQGLYSRAVGRETLPPFLAQLAAVSVAVALAIRPDPQSLLLGVALIIAGGILMTTRRRFFSEAPLLGFFVVAELVALSWHLPSLRSLYLWAYDTSFGPMAQMTDQRYAGFSLFTILVRTLTQYTPYMLAMLGMVAIPALTGLRRADLSLRSGGPLPLIAGAGLMMTPIIAALSLSGTSDMRRGMPAMLVLYVGVFALAAQPNGLVPRLRIFLLAMIALGQFAVAAANSFAAQPTVLGGAYQHTGYYRAPTVSPDPNVAILETLLALGVSSGFVSAHTYCYRDYATCERRRYPWFEPSALATLALERGLTLRVHFVGDLDFSQPDSLASQLRARGVDHLLIDMFDEPEKVNLRDPYTAHVRQLLALSERKLPAGLQRRGCVEIGRPVCVIDVVPAP